MMGRYVSNKVEANNEQHRSKSGELWDLNFDPIEPGDPCSSICWAFYANRDNCLQHALRLGVPAMETINHIASVFNLLETFEKKKAQMKEEGEG